MNGTVFSQPRHARLSTGNGDGRCGSFFKTNDGSRRIRSRDGSETGVKYERGRRLRICKTRTPREGGNNRVLLAIFRRHPHSNINEVAHLSGPVSARRGPAVLAQVFRPIPPHPSNVSHFWLEENVRRSLAALVFVESWPRYKHECWLWSFTLVTARYWLTRSAVRWIEIHVPSPSEAAECSVGMLPSPPVREGWGSAAEPGPGRHRPYHYECKARCAERDSIQFPYGWQTDRNSKISPGSSLAARVFLVVRMRRKTLWR
jgi:hypothetical protein